jgi:hypothetical protein
MEQSDFTFEKMKNNNTKKDDEAPPTTRDNSGNLLMDAPGYIDPDLQDLLLTDITTKELQVIAEVMEVEYLGQAVFPGTFPAMGIITGQNNRLMVSLVCDARQQRKFLLSTSSF